MTQASTQFSHCKETDTAYTCGGLRDDICSIGQTVAAQDLCTGVRPYRKTHHVQPGVGHYGVFNGRKWRQQIYPRVRDMVHACEAQMA